jgi:DNA polymerase-4
MGIRKIVHIDMDAFYASVEQRDNPELRGKPVIVAWKGNRSVVCAASYEARKFGVRSAMPAVRAERLCPEAIIIPPDFTRYRVVSRLTREIFKRHTDLVEPLSLDEAYLDVTENKTGLPTATRVAITIREQVPQELNLTASAGVAPNKFLAKLASDWRKPDGLFVIQTENVNSFLLPLLVSRLPGVGKVTEKRLEELGVRAVKDLLGTIKYLAEVAVLLNCTRTLNLEIPLGQFRFKQNTAKPHINFSSLFRSTEQRHMWPESKLRDVALIGP